MAIFDFPKEELKPSAALEDVKSDKAPSLEEGPSTKDRIFSGIATRLFFLLLLSADVLWACYALLQLILGALGMACTARKVAWFKSRIDNAWVSLRRSIVCGVSLVVALFSPSFGIMIACTYFLMYDKKGIEEVVPSSLQSQFKELMPSGS